jgi:hypothetical protein
MNIEASDVYEVEKNAFIEHVYCTGVHIFSSTSLIFNRPHSASLEI